MIETPWTFCIPTFGCKVNQYETEAIREAWVACNGHEVDIHDEADLVCINSCAITARAERDARQMLYHIHETHPHSTILLTGCAAALFPSFHPLRNQKAVSPHILLLQQEKSRLLDESWIAGILEERQKRLASLAAGTETRTTASAASGDHGQTTPVSVRNGAYPPFTIRRYSRARPVLKIQDGCSQRCTYCIVPSMRPDPRSRSHEDILQEARRLLSQGYAELILSGINLRQYGRHQPECGTLWDLISVLDRELRPEFPHARLRISSIEPSQLTQDGLEVLGRCGILCRQLHLSLQHASPSVLQRMGRGHCSSDQVRTALTQIRSIWPVFGLGCDIISGFPAETEEDHVFLMEFCRDLPFTYAHVFPYSRRPGTPAAAFPDQIPHDVRVRRAAELRELFRKKNRSFQDMLLEQRIPLSVIVDSTQKQDLRKGICEYYVPCYLQDVPEETHEAMCEGPYEQKHDADTSPAGEMHMPLRTCPVGHIHNGLLVQRVHED